MHPPRWRGDGILPEAFQAPAVDVERDAGDEAGALGAQEGDGVRQLLGPAPAAERVLAGGEPSRLVLGADAELGDEPGSIAFPHAGVDPAGTDGVDEDVVGSEL